jgi:hypothetical protein
MAIITMDITDHVPKVRTGVGTPTTEVAHPIGVMVITITTEPEKVTISEVRNMTSH